jgi:hypothetical protein
MSWEAVQYAIKDCRGIKPQDRAVLTAMAYHSKKEAPASVFCSQKRLAEMCDVSRSAVKTSLRRLQEAGELEMVLVGGIGRDKAHLATDWRLTGLERAMREGSKADGSKVKIRPQRGQNPIPGRGQDPIPIEDKDKREEEDAKKSASPPSSPALFLNEAGEQRSAQPNSLPNSDSAPQSRSPLSNAEHRSKSKNDVCAGPATMTQHRRREIANAHANDESRWREYLGTVPEFRGKDVDAVFNDYRNRCRSNNDSPNRMTLVSWLNNQGLKVNFAPVAVGGVKPSAAELRMMEMEQRQREQAAAKVACSPNTEPPCGNDIECISRFLGEADALAFAAELEPQMVGAGA